MVKKMNWSVLLGAAFLMATSAIGPGFLTQTVVFTEKLSASFAFVILLSVLLDIGAQLNIWRLLVVSGLQAPAVANELLPGLGYFLTGLVVTGGLAFNTGNLAGTGLGLQVLTGLNPAYGALLSAVLAIGIFLVKEAGRAMDAFVKVLGLAMIGLSLYVAVVSRPPVAEALLRSVAPLQFDAIAVVTLVGGTVGGYITFAGGHRLLDAGLRGTGCLPQVNRSAISGILLTAILRCILFLAALGVVAQGLAIDQANPPASVFLQAAGQLGFRFFGVVMWAAAITSVVGASYTSVSFLRSSSSHIERYQRTWTASFIILSVAIFMIAGRPVQILVAAGTLNGLILPVALAVMLLASRRRNLVGEYRHPRWLTVFGLLVVLVMGALSVRTIWQWVTG